MTTRGIYIVETSTAAGGPSVRLNIKLSLELILTFLCTGHRALCLKTRIGVIKARRLMDTSSHETPYVAPRRGTSNFPNFMKRAFSMLHGR